MRRMSDLPPHVQRPRGSLEFRRRVPRDLQPRLGKAEIKLGLSQAVGDDVVLAGLVAATLSAHVDRAFAEMRRQNFSASGDPDQTLVRIFAAAEGATLDLLPRLIEQFAENAVSEHIARLRELVERGPKA